MDSASTMEPSLHNFMVGEAPAPSRACLFKSERCCALGCLQLIWPKEGRWVREEAPENGNLEHSVTAENTVNKQPPN